ncbi:MAG: GAF domain-containing protein [Kofleriaceae bacterium]
MADGGDKARVFARMVRELANAARDPQSLIQAVPSMAAAAMDACCELTRVIGDELVPIANALPRPSADDPRAMLFGDRLPVSGTSAAARAARTGVTVHIAQITEEHLKARYADEPKRRDLARKMGLGGALFVPIRARGKAIAVLALLRRGEGSTPFDVADIEFAEQLGELAALAVTNAQLVAEAQARAVRYELLATLSREFSRVSATYQDHLDLIARRVGETIGDSCAVRMLRDDGAQYAVHTAVYNRDPELATRHLELLAPLKREPTGFAGRVIATRTSIMAQITPEFLATMPAPVRALLTTLGHASLIAVPIMVYEAPVAVMIVGRTREMPPFTVDDQRLLDDIAAHAATAIANARLIEQLRELANKPDPAPR